ncbi:glycosyltransferase family 39 protein [Micromonospora robiginosa]|uniref:Glycosyltransferase family 39 protein n=1 Tax=Micromonospora robiginosa TaxID=2749844 RepID=A0A7L6AZU7_9ACTN|nr:glycosyltransferase family 39 protein [Micromonospora ferruginea]QLQ35035.1 glycosyltransferase family 39 protein [Micromonospora ferruginea]
MDAVTTEEPSRPVSEAPDAPDEPRHTPAGRLRHAARHALPALALYAVIRLVGLLTVWIWAGNVGADPVEQLTRADGTWYLAIARHGYDAYEKTQSNMAFFPLYPGLTAGLERLTPLSPRESALLVAWVAGLAAAWGLFAIGAHLHDRRTGVLLAALWAAVPHGVVESMGYSESLFTALAAWTLYALLRHRWLAAGVLCLFAGLTRPTASSLIPVVGLAALLAVLRRRDGWRPYAALLLAPAGWLAYLAWVGWRTGRPDGWFHIQSAGWGTTFDFGVYTVDRGQQALVQVAALPLLVVTVVALVSLMFFVLSVLDRQPWQLLLYSGLLLVTTLGAAGYYHSKARFLLPAFPLLLPAAVGLARAGRARAATVLVTLVIFSAYFGGYLLLIWTKSP